MRGRGRPLGSRTMREKPCCQPAPREVDLYAKRVGQIVRDAREESGISSRSLSVAAGLHPNAVAQVERGGKSNSRGPYLQTLIRIARALGMAPRELLP